MTLEMDGSPDDCHARAQVRDQISRPGGLSFWVGEPHDVRREKVIFTVLSHEALRASDVAT